MWVAESTSGGVSAPNGVTCGPWVAVRQSIEKGTGYMELDGVEYDMYQRSCGTTTQTVWVARVAPIDVARAAYASVERTVTEPRVSFSPTQDPGGVVGIATWLAVAPEPAVTGTATLPTLSATATARVVSIEWRPGSRVPGGGSQITCTPWGSTERGECTWTPAYPSVRRVTGTDDERYHGTVTLVWEVSWVASDGSSGTFEPLRTTTGYAYAVSEVQAIGERGG